MDLAWLSVPLSSGLIQAIPRNSVEQHNSRFSTPPSISELAAKSLGRVCPNFKVLGETSNYLNIFYMLCQSYTAAFYSSPQQQRFRGISTVHFDIVCSHVRICVEAVREVNPTARSVLKKKKGSTINYELMKSLLKKMAIMASSK